MANKEYLEGRLKELEEELSKTKDNKATNKHLAKLRSKVATVKKEVINASKKIHGSGFFVKKTGDATVTLLGFPSAGKSSILNALTNANSKTAQYAFTTTDIIPGTMLYRDAHIQVLDMPGLIAGAHKGLGGGSSVIAQMRVSDLVVFVIDITNLNQVGVILDELFSLNIYINRKKPNIQIRQNKDGHGIALEVNKSKMSYDDIKIVLNGFGIFNANVRIWDPVEEDEFISFISNKSLYLNAIMVLNKIDMVSDFQKVANQISSRYGMEVVPISALHMDNLESLKAKIYDNLSIMRVYLKPRLNKIGQPITTKSGITVGNLAKRLHTEISSELKCAYVNGRSVKFANQRVGIEHVLKDGDAVTFIKIK